MPCNRIDYEAMLQTADMSMSDFRPTPFHLFPSLANRHFITAISSVLLFQGIIDFSSNLSLTPQYLVNPNYFYTQK